MIGFILADLRRLWLGGIVVVLLVALATALGVAVTLQERSLRLGSARAADKFDLVIGAAGSEPPAIRAESEAGGGGFKGGNSFLFSPAGHVPKSDVAGCVAGE